MISEKPVSGHSTHNREIYSNPKMIQSDDEDDNPMITPDLVRQQIIELGYDPENLSPELIDEFVQELSLLMSQDSRIYRIKHEDGDEDGTDDPEKESVSKQHPQLVPQDRNNEEDGILERLERLDLTQVRQIVAEQKARTDGPGLRYAEKIPIHYNNTDKADASDSDHSEVVSLAESHLSSWTTLSHKQSTKGFIRPPVSKQQRRKHDPVSRFHEHQKQWAKDRFLKRNDLSSTSRISSNFVPSYYASSSSRGGTSNPHQPVKRKEPPAMRRPHTYVVPTSKDRRDVIWEIRNRLAHFQS